MRTKNIQDLLAHMGEAPAEECVPAITTKIKALAADPESKFEDFDKLLCACMLTPNVCSKFFLLAFASTMTLWETMEPVKDPFEGLPE